jgi:hypothetical protein
MPERCRRRALTTVARTRVTRARADLRASRRHNQSRIRALASRQNEQCRRATTPVAALHRCTEYQDKLRTKRGDRPSTRAVTTLAIGLATQGSSTMPAPCGRRLLLPDSPGHEPHATRRPPRDGESARRISRGSRRNRRFRRRTTDTDAPAPPPSLNRDY